MYVCVCVFVCVCIYICMHMHVIMKTMCPLGYHHNGFVAHDVWLHIAGTNEPKSAQQAKQEA